MNYGIGNVKAKSSGGGGGGIPVITLQASQMISQTQIQFTEEQYNTIVANGCFYLDLLGSQQLLMTCVNASNLADIQCYNISQTGSGLQLATIDLNKSTYIGVLGISPYPQAKQLYQHNVRIKLGSNYYELFLQIINDIPNTMFTDKASIVQYLIDNGHTIESGNSDMDTNLLRASGRVQYDGSSNIEIKMVEGIYHNKSLNNSIYAVGYNDSTSWRDIQITTGMNNLTIKEFIKAL